MESEQENIVGGAEQSVPQEPEVVETIAEDIESESDADLPAEEVNEEAPAV